MGMLAVTGKINFSCVRKRNICVVRGPVMDTAFSKR